MAISATHRGWWWDVDNTRLRIYVNGTLVGYFDNASPYLVVASGLTVTAGNLVVTAGSLNAGGAAVWLTQKVGPMAQRKTVTTAADTATLTVAQFRSQHIDGTPTAAAAYTTPTAAAIVADITNAEVGSSYYLSINNMSAGANTITLTAGNGITLDGTVTVAQNVCRLFLVTCTNVTAASEAVTIYGMG